MGGKAKTQKLYTSSDGLVHDLAWSPTKNEFAVIVGAMPPAVKLHDGATGKELSHLGISRRNTLKWNPFGRFVAVAGFGTLPGDMDFYDRSCDETMASLRAALTVDCSWAPDGRRFIASTTAPRMNEGNQVSIYKYSGERLLHMAFRPEKSEGRHVDTGTGARRKTEALLFSVTWRPCSYMCEDRPASPRSGMDTGKREKGLPEGEAAVPKTTTTAWRARNDGGGTNLVNAMMRGEIAAPEPEAGWGLGAPMEDWEVRKLERERKKAAEQKEKEKKDTEKQKLKDFAKADKDKAKRIKEIQAQLEELEAQKSDDWDDLTEEDEERLELEMQLRSKLAELGGSAS